MENEWTPQMMQTLGIDEPSLPVIWDADFLYGRRDAAGADTYFLCEINASSCFAIPDEAPGPTLPDKLIETGRLTLQYLGNNLSELPGIAFVLQRDQLLVGGASCLWPIEWDR